MQQIFNTRNYSIHDFSQWEDKGELTLAPKFQRRSVWSPLARSYLMDTIIRGKPIPKIYMRQDINPKTRRTTREVVDGQQRLSTVLTYIKDGFKISKIHNEEFGGKYFSQLDDDTKKDILKYEFVVDLLQDIPDKEVYDIFARLNTYAVTLNYQEIRHGKWFGEFRTSVYNIANEYNTFWIANKIITEKNMARMAEAELVSELLIAETSGIRAKEKAIIDNFYRDNDTTFPDRKKYEERFKDIIDKISGIMESTLAASSFHSSRLFYPLFCAIYHMQFGLPEFDSERKKINQKDFPKLKIALNKIDDIIESAERAKEEAEIFEEEMAGSGPSEDEPAEAEYEVGEFTAEETHEQAEQFSDMLLPEERSFYHAYEIHWVHASNRRIMTEYICALISQTLQG